MFQFFLGLKLKIRLFEFPQIMIQFYNKMLVYQLAILYYQKTP